MGKLLFLAAVLLFVFSVTAADVTVADVSFGVKAGDWIEYTVSTTGAPSEGHDVVWARMEILSISHGEVLAVNTTTKAVNGSFSSLVMTLDPASGQVDVWAIIPADLSMGSSFYDKNLGNIPIIGEEPQTFGGVTRDTTFYNSTERFKRWYKATGVFLEGTDNVGAYSLTATFLRTNMWTPEILGLEPAIFYAVLAVVVAWVVGATLIFAGHRGAKPIKLNG